MVGWCEGVMYLVSPGHPILAYSWARPAILVVGKGRGGMFLFCFFSFIPVPHSSLFLSFISSTISSISFLPFSGRRHKMTHKGWRVFKPQHKASQEPRKLWGESWYIALEHKVYQVCSNNGSRLTSFAPSCIYIRKILRSHFLKMY